MRWRSEMDPRAIRSFFCAALLFVVVRIPGAQSKPVFVDCGSNSTVVVDGRSWVGDEAPSGLNFTLSSPGTAAVTTSKLAGEPTYAPLYRTARIFAFPANYTFNVSAGAYYLRLHFHPISSGSYNANDSIFDVVANELKLFSEYNISEEISNKSSYLQTLDSNSTVSALLKEYFLNLTSSELLIEFVPVPGSFAFVSAIEIVPVLYPLFFDFAGKVGSVGTTVPLTPIDRGLETMYRLNVGGREIEPAQDHDLWRRWEPDSIYVTLAGAGSAVSNSSNVSYVNSNDSSIAPLLLYEDARVTTNNDLMDKRFNMSWRFAVDPGFEYLVRLHFCELEFDGRSQRIFRIYINFRSAAQNYDVFARAGGQMNKAYHDDFLDSSSEQSSLMLQLGPDPSSSMSGTYALLSGLEIFKLSRNGNLAHAFDTVGADTAGTESSKQKLRNVAVGASAVAVFAVSIACFVFFHRSSSKKKKKRSSNAVKSAPPGWRPLVLHDVTGSTANARSVKPPSTPMTGVVLGNRTGRRFTLTEIRNATRNFDESLIIGTGGFGKVYKGELEDGNVVAVKRANPQSQQGLAEFETEIEMLSKLRHGHLVSMIGSCDEQSEMILVYEYMGSGTLRSHLFGSDLPPLSWKQRLEICIGAARGLHYLHTGAERGIIHRDVKTTNILLDENLVAKMADFGLSKDGPALDHTHVSTAVKGSFGYLDPEYFRRQQLTQKSDVYSFGVVLFEVVCARPVINPTLPREQINLAEWALRWQRLGGLGSILDPKLDGRYSAESLKKFGEIAGKCLADEGKNRPTMGDVLWNLEYALQLHEAYARSSEKGSASQSSELPPGLGAACAGEPDSCPASARAEERSMLPRIWTEQFSEDGIEAEHSQTRVPRSSGG